MIKNYALILVVLFSLFALTVPASATEPPTLEDTGDEAPAAVMDTQAEPLFEEPLDEEPPAMEGTGAEEPADMMAPQAESLFEAPLDEEPSTVASPLLVSVTEMTIATAVVDREPVETGTVFPTETQRLYCHSRIASMGPTTITHVWYRNGERVAEIPLRIGAASSWRTWSSKAIVPTTPASWHVEVVSEDGVLLAQRDFIVE